MNLRRRLKRRLRISKPAEGPLSWRGLIELSLFSAFNFVFAALLIQFFLTLETAILLKVFSIDFQYRLFTIIFEWQDSLKWTENHIYLVFGSGPLILSAMGFLLLFPLKKLRMVGWKTRLFLTWSAFILVNSLPCGIIAGVLFFEGFGFAFHWFIDSYILRGLIAFIVLIIMVYFSSFWKRLFLKASYSSVFINNGNNQRIFLNNAYLMSFVYGFLILLLFNRPFNNFYWPAVLLSLGYLAISFLDNTTMRFKLQITKSDKRIFTSRLQFVCLIILLVLIWLAGSFRINF